MTTMTMTTMLSAITTTAAATTMMTTREEEVAAAPTIRHSCRPRRLHGLYKLCPLFGLLLFSFMSVSVLGTTEQLPHVFPRSDQQHEDLVGESVAGLGGSRGENGERRAPYPYLPDPLPDSYDDDDFASYVPPGGYRYSEYIDGRAPYDITPFIRSKSDDVARRRRTRVRGAMRHAWTGYRTHAFGRDELMPQTKKGRDVWGGMGTTLVDSLDTLWLMGLNDEFYEGRDWVRDNLDHDAVGRVSVFETAIRSLGGLLSAYDLSGDDVFLIQADDLGSRLMMAFDTPSGVPYAQVDLKSGVPSNFGWLPDRAVLAEFGTLQLEFRYLSSATGRRSYADKSERIFDILNALQPDDGLFPIYFSNKGETAVFANKKISFGAMGDSVYEYFLKTWLQGGRTESAYREMYDKSIGGLHDELLCTSRPSGLTYIAERSGKKLVHRMDHLACFLPGTLALGAYTDPLGLNSTRAQRDLRTGKALAYTCYQMYARMETGISPEYVRFNDADDADADDFKVDKRGSYYMLRPEAVESFFVLNQLTGDPIYREWGWEIFRSIERFCKTNVAYGGLRDVRDVAREPEDKMESFFLAETLKYLYLLQDPDTEVDILNKHVFNTEAHPLRLLDQVERRDVCKARSFPYLSDPPGKDHDFTSFRPPGGDRYPEYREGRSPYNITMLIKNQSDKLARTRREHVRAAMRHAWKGYKTYAFGMDELLPRSRKGRDVWGGMGTTLVDALDTLWLMGLTDEFYEGRDWVRDHLNHDKVRRVSVFETAIRSLGGLLSAYDLSGDGSFLDQANDLGSRLMKAFDTPSGIPYALVDLSTGKASDFSWLPDRAILSEFGTLQVEFRYLARATGIREYADKAERIYEILHSLQPDNGLLPLYFKHKDTTPTKGSGKISFGAMGDSAYEYFLKVWLQGGKKEAKYRSMYDKSIQGLHDELLHKSEPSGLTYIAERNGKKIEHKMDHLVCFLSGTLALGAYTDPQGVSSQRAQRDLQTAKALAYTCHQMYARQETGISPEIVHFTPMAGPDINGEDKENSEMDFRIVARDSFYILRPEAVESFFVLNQLTGDPIYREWGWEVFQAIERFCKTDVAYGSIQNVNKPGQIPTDKMESFFLAETLKYLYLLQDPDTDIDILNKHVFNTEAHPLRFLEQVEPRRIALDPAPAAAESTSAKTAYDAASSDRLPLGGNRFREYKDGVSPYNITELIKNQSDELGRTRREYVKAAMRHAWKGYKRYAYGFDELKPHSKKGQNSWGGMGTTLVDSLGTLWLMDMKAEFYEARDWVRDKLDHGRVGKVSVFETTIRNLGGLLSAYDLSGDEAFLRMADDLGGRLLNAFDSPSGIPFTQVNLATGEAKNRPQIPKATLLAECGTLQVEFRYLAKVTGKGEYADKAERVHQVLASLQPDSGLIPVSIKNIQAKAEFDKRQTISFGSMGDSAYEYFLKVWLQGGRKENENIYRSMYDKAIQGLHDELLMKSGLSGLTYVAEIQSSVVKKRMDHLVCFLGGTLALGAYTDPQGLASFRAQRDLQTGKALAYTCYQMYAQTKTGIAPEAVSFEGEDLEHDKKADFYLLRPEAVETFYVLHQLTGDPVYREWGWEIFQSIERFCKTDVAYGGLHRVDSSDASSEDRMESFFLAETLKYLYLLFDPDTNIDILYEYVFNTEAHPLRTFTKIKNES